MFEITVVNMANEMYNDGLYYQEQALLAEGSFDKWRFQRSAIISFATSFESYTNLYIVNKLNQKADILPNEEKILTFLTKRVSYGPLAEIRNIYNKMRFMEKLYGLRDRELETQAFAEFQKVIDLRNSIVHYSHGRFNEIYGADVEEVASSGSELLRKLVFEHCSLMNISVPSYYEAETYSQIKG